MSTSKPSESSKGKLSGFQSESTVPTKKLPESSELPDTPDPEYLIRFPDIKDQLEQDEEWIEVQLNGDWQRIRCHDYDRIFEIPGLYESLFYEALECTSPKRVAELLNEELEDADISPASLRVLDVGAGNGMMGEQLAESGVEKIVGVDILPEAKIAAERDRPGLYEDYLVADLTDLNADQQTKLELHRFNAMTTIAALGFGDMPPRAFAQA